MRHTENGAFSVIAITVLAGESSRGTAECCPRAWSTSIARRVPSVCREVNKWNVNSWNVLHYVKSDSFQLLKLFTIRCYWVLGRYGDMRQNATNCVLSRQWRGFGALMPFPPKNGIPCYFPVPASKVENLAQLQRFVRFPNFPIFP